MTNGWAVLALLFTVRLVMAFQFQSVAAIAPAIMQQIGVDLADLGLLIALYLAPGIAFALPGGEIGRRFGDRSVVLFGLTLMIAGGLVMALAPTWPWQLTGRLLAGVGGVLLNVLMSKMVTDWFAGREISTAMAVFVTSWPVGIALALFTLPPLLAATSVAGVMLATSAFVALGFVLILAFYRAPPLRSGTATAGVWPTGTVLHAVIVAGCIWGLYNAALAMVFGYGTAMLTERGWSLTAAGSATSLVLWLVSLSVPLGGILADRTGGRTTIMLTSFSLFTVSLLLAARTDLVIPMFILLGLFGGLAAGPIMSLPVSVLSPNARAAGMGLYYTFFYLMVVAAPIIAGRLAMTLGTPAATFDMGAFMLLDCIGLLWLFERLRARTLHSPVPSPS